MNKPEYSDIYKFLASIAGRSLIFQYKNRIHAKFHDFVNFFAHTKRFSPDSNWQIVKSGTRKIRTAPYTGVQSGTLPYMGVAKFCFCIKK